MKKDLSILCLCIFLTSLQSCGLQPSHSSQPEEIATAVSPDVNKQTLTALTSTATQALTATPVLGKEETEELLLNMLKGNDLCTLPCWWGILPGESSLTQLNERIEPLSSIIQSSPYFQINVSGQPFLVSGMGVNLRKENEIIDLHVSWYTDKNKDKVELISIKPISLTLENGEYQNAYSSNFYKTALIKYKISQILSELGKPSKILTFAEIYKLNPYGNSETFQIWLLYPERGVFVRYDMPLRRINELGQGCPSESIVSLWLTPPDTTGFYAGIVPTMDGYSGFSHHKTIEESTTLSVDYFYMVYKDSTDECVTTPLSIWPSP